MRIVRPWAAEGDFFEIVASDEEDVARMLARLRARLDELTEAERLAAAQRYLSARYAHLATWPSRG